MVTGPTGCGKTASIRLLCEKIGIPFVEIPVPQLSPASYKGTTIQSVLFAAVSNILNQHNGYPNRMIFYLDEFGKILQRGPELAPMIQNELLKLLEPGAQLTHEIPPGSDVQQLPFQALVILSDALSFVEGAIDRPALVQAGFAPELAGRIHLVHPFRALGIDDFVKILETGKGNPLEEQRRTLAALGLALECDAETYRTFAELAVKDGSGGRALQHMVNNVVSAELQRNVFGPRDDRAMDDAKTLRITSATIRTHFPNGNGMRKERIGFT